MAKKEVKGSQEGQIFNEVEETLTKTEQFIENNMNTLGYIIIGVVSVVLLFFAYNKFYVTPQNIKAQNAMFMAERYFEMDSLELALNGTNNFDGFIDVSEEYSSTKAGNLANYYIALIYIKQSNFSEALDYLNKYNGEDIALATIVEGLKGDVYVELGEFDKAMSQYENAYTRQVNKVITPIYMKKAALLAMENEDLAKAEDLFRQLNKEYKETLSGRDATKYLAKIGIIE